MCLFKTYDELVGFSSYQTKRSGISEYFGQKRAVLYERLTN